MLKAGEKKMESAYANKKSISELKKAKANLEVELQEKTLRLKELEENFEYLFQHSLYPILLINLKGSRNNFSQDREESSPYFSS